MSRIHASIPHGSQPAILDDSAAWTFRVEVNEAGFYVACFRVDQGFHIFDQTGIGDLADFLSDKVETLVGIGVRYRDAVLLGQVLSWGARFTKEAFDELFEQVVTHPEGQLRPRAWLQSVWDLPIRCLVDLLDVCDAPVKTLPGLECQLGLPSLHRDGEADVDGLMRAIDLALLAAGQWNAHRGAISLRRDLVARYDLDAQALGYRPSKLGESIILQACRQHDGSIAPAQSDRENIEQIPVGSLLPTSCLVHDPELMEQLDAFRNGTVTRHLEDNRWRSELHVSGLPNLIVEYAGHRYRMGCGGLHSVVPSTPDLGPDDVLLELDVSSFYPAMIASREIHPYRLGASFSRVFRGLLAQRLEAKRCGDSSLAHALKIPLNAVFGKLSDRYSPLYDPAAGLAVALSGQVYLLTLIERLVEAGCHVVAANTDGVFVTCMKSDEASVRAAAGAWEQETGFVLETERYRRIWARDVTNYIAVKEDGSIKAKGAFSSDSGKASGRVIAKACLAYLCDGVDPYDFVGQCDDLRDFLFLAEAPLRKWFSVGSRDVQEAVRWYVASAGETILLHDGDNSHAVPYGKHAVALDTIDPVSMPEDLDRSWYVREAQRLILQAQRPAEVATAQAEAEGLRDLGLVLAPKNDLGHAIFGSRLDDPDPEDDGSACVYALVTGMETRTLVLDIDEPSRVSTSLYQMLRQERDRFLVSWHGEGSADDVLDGRKRGAITMRYDGADARIRTVGDSRFTRKHGFEVAFGNKHQTLIGRHREALDRYHTQGAPGEAPDGLLDYLGLLLGKPCPPAETRSTPADDHERLLEACRSVFGPTWGMVYIRDDFRGVSGPVPGKETSLRVRVQNGRVWLHSFHQKIPRDQWRDVIQERYDVLSIERPAGFTEHELWREAAGIEPPDEAQAVVAASMTEAFASVSPIIAIKAPTGKGKSFSAAELAVDRHLKGMRSLIVSQDKQGMATFIGYLRIHWEKHGRSPDDLLLQIVVAPSSAEEDGSSQGGDTEVDKEALIVVTHHCYASRRRLSTRLYTVLRWVENYRPVVILDEFHLFHERQNHGQEIDGRYRLIHGMHGDWRRMTRCPSYGGRFFCRTCHRRSLLKVRSRGTHLEMSMPETIDADAFDLVHQSEFAILDEHLPLTGSVLVREMSHEVIGLAQDEGYLQVREIWGSAEHAESDLSEHGGTIAMRVIRDLIECSYCPSMVVPRLLDPNDKIIPDPHEAALFGEGSDGPALTSASTTTHAFPFQPCGVRTLMLYDRLPLWYIAQHADQLVVLTATMSHGARQFLESCSEGRHVEYIEVEDPSWRPLDGAVVIGLQTKIRLDASLSREDIQAIDPKFVVTAGDGLLSSDLLDHIGNRCTDVGKRALLFRPTKAEATRLNMATKREGWVFFDAGSYSSRNSCPDPNRLHMVTYSRSVLGTGANLGEYDLVIVDACFCKPHHLYQPRRIDHRSYLREQTEDQTRTVQQNIGRILRGNGQKLIFVTGVTLEQFTGLVEQVGKLTKTPPQAHLYRDNVIVAVTSMLESLQEGRLIVHPEPGPETQINKPRSALSHKQRAIKDATEDQRSVDEKLVDLASQGWTWSKAASKLNLYRRHASERERLRAIYDATSNESEVAT